MDSLLNDPDMDDPFDEDLELEDDPEPATFCDDCAWLAVCGEAFPCVRGADPEDLAALSLDPELAARLTGADEASAGGSSPVVGGRLFVGGPAASVRAFRPAADTDPEARP